MATISQLAIKAEIINLRQALQKQKSSKPECIFVSSDEELEEAKKKYGEDLRGVTVLKWNLNSNNRPANDH